MRTHTVVLRPEDLVEFLRREGRDSNTKDYEFHAALVLGRFHAKQFATGYLIAFPVRREKAKRITPKETWEYLRSVLRTCLNEDTPFDVIVVAERDVANRGYKPARGAAFQLKRLISTNRDATQTVIEFLNDVVPRKYGPTRDASLVLLLEPRDRGGLTVDVDRVRDSFDPTKFPFGGAMFILSGEGKIIIGELWPNFGRVEYSLDEWFDG